MITLQHTYRPRGVCRDLFHCRAGEVVLTGPAGTGKSRAALEKLHLAMLLNPGANGLIVRKTAASLGSTALQTWRRFVISEAERAGIVTYYGGSQAEPAQYRYRNGSSIKIGGMDRATKIMSSEYDMIYVQEAIELTVNDWESLLTRLRNGVMSYQQLLADTNPSTPAHFLKQRIDRGDTVALESRHTDNPVLYDDNGELTDRGREYVGILDKLTGVRRLRLRDGLWVSAEGVIYDMWDDARNVADLPPGGIPVDWQRYWVIDFGFTNPFVLQCWAMDHDGRLWLYREIYRTRRLVEDHVRDILAIVAPGGEWIEPRPVAVICDHDAEDRATFERHSGMRTTAARKSVSQGLQATQARVSAGRIRYVRGALVHRDAELDKLVKPVSTLEEVPGYIWAGDTKDQPLKENDHGMDAMRYMVMHVDLRNSPNIRWMHG